MGVWSMMLVIVSGDRHKLNKNMLNLKFFVMANKKPSSVYNTQVSTADGVLKVADEARAPRETIQKGDKFLIVEEYAAIIGSPWMTPTGDEILTAERIPAVKLDRNGKPVKGTVLWVSQICPQDYLKVNAFETELYDARQDGNLVATIKGKVLTAFEPKVILARKWDNANGGYVTDENGDFVGVQKPVYRFVAGMPASVTDVAAATELLKAYLEKEYAGILA